MYVYNLKNKKGEGEGEGEGEAASAVLAGAAAAGENGDAGGGGGEGGGGGSSKPALPPLVPRVRKHQAVHDNDTAAVKLLIASGANGVAKLAEADGDGRGALHWAASEGHSPMVGLLLACSTKAVVDRRDGGGWTPLLSAFSAGHFDAMALLLRAGADPMCRTKGGQTFVHYHKGRAELLSAALKVLAGGEGGGGGGGGGGRGRGGAGEQTHTPWTEKQITELVNARDVSGATALHRCGVAKTAAGALATGRVLLQFGADPNIRDAEGETPLHAAARYGLDAWIEVLISNGAKEGAKNAGGKVAKEVYRKRE